MFDLPGNTDDMMLPELPSSLAGLDTLSGTLLLETGRQQAPTWTANHVLTWLHAGRSCA